jgi:hypothetical protein
MCHVRPFDRALSYTELGPLMRRSGKKVNVEFSGSNGFRGEKLRRADQLILSGDQGELARP